MIAQKKICRVSEQARKFADFRKSQNKEKRKMKFCLRIFSLSIIFAFLFLSQTYQVSAQQDPCRGLGVRRIQTSQLVTVNFFKANPANGAIIGTPLSTSQIESGFNEGEAVAFQVSAPYCFYTYVVNVSEWDGISLQYPSNASENIGTIAGQNKEIAFALDNISKTKSTTGREELLILITKNRIDSPDLQTILNTSGEEKPIKLSQSNIQEGQTLLKQSLDSPTQSSPGTGRQNKFVKVISVGCRIASIFFPFARIACATGGFSAATYIKAQGNAIGVSPTADTGQLVFRFSFPVQPK